MNIIGLFIASILVLIGVAYKRTDTPKVLSSQDNVTPTITQTPTQTITATQSPIPTMTPYPTKITNTPTPTYTSSETTNSLYRYPDSIVKQERKGLLELESRDDAAKITDWYKNIFDQKRMNTKTVVQTKANGKIQNKLVANSSREEVEITITQASEDAIVKIVINITNK